MRKQKRHYSPEFKQKAVDLSYARGNVSQVCKELDIPTSVLHRWRGELKKYGKNSFPGTGIAKQTDQEKEIAFLKRQLKDMELERDILKKAVSIFSMSDRRNLGL